tara:strand:+ start:705 stop:887 length:183 start_codon:yes stop_codon:yes gene_type:complete
MASIVEEFENDKTRCSKFENGDIRLIIKKPSDMSQERFMTLSARLEKILDHFQANIRLDK